MFPFFHKIPKILSPRNLKYYHVFFFFFLYTESRLVKELTFNPQTNQPDQQNAQT